MRIVACDDEEFFINQLETYSRKYQDETGNIIDYCKFKNGKDLLDDLERHPETDLFILDIKMPENGGVKIAQEVRKRNKRARIIFLTSIADYVLEGYEIGIIRYWIKPLEYEKFQRIVEDIVNEIRETRQKYIVEHIGGTIEKVPFDNIVYIETRGRKTMVHKKNGEYESTKTMTAYQEKLDENFFRCHAAYIVNLSCIIKIDGVEILLENGDTIYASKGKRKTFVEAFYEYIKTR